MAWVPSLLPTAALWQQGAAALGGQVPSPEEMIQAAMAKDEERALEAFRGWIAQAEVELDEGQTNLAWVSFYAGWCALKMGTPISAPTAQDSELAQRMVERVTTPRHVLLARQRRNCHGL